MIYTVTFNPAIDYIMKLDDIVMGATNRSFSEEYFIGGKGINVSRVLNSLGVKTKALGFVSGFTGGIICDFLEKEGIETDFVRLESGFTRINVKLKAAKETEINGKGPDIPQKALDLFFEKLCEIKSTDTVVLSGSIPQGMRKDIYEVIAKSLCERNIRFAVDATGELLLGTLKHKPFLIKPNIDELTELFGKVPENDGETAFFANELRKKGARNVLVSLGKEGALLCDENGGVTRVQAHKGEAVNTVGSGDSMLAGFIAGYEKTGDHAYALKLGNAAGAATAFSSDLAEAEMIRKFYRMDV